MLLLNTEHIIEVVKLSESPKNSFLRSVFISLCFVNCVQNKSALCYIMLDKISLPSYKMFAETGERTEQERGFQCFHHFSLPDKHLCSTWNAFGFTSQTAAIFLPLITLGLDALARHIPRPMDDRQGKSNGNQPTLTLLRFLLGTRLRESGRERRR